MKQPVVLFVLTLYLLFEFKKFVNLTNFQGMILTVVSAIKLVQQDYTMRICFNVQFEYMNFMYSHTSKPANDFFPLSLSPVICQAKDTV